MTRTTSWSRDAARGQIWTACSHVRPRRPHLPASDYCRRVRLCRSTGCRALVGRPRRVKQGEPVHPRQLGLAQASSGIVTGLTQRKVPHGCFANLTPRPTHADNSDGSGCLLLGTAAAANAAPKADLSPPKVLSAENSRGEAADIAVRDDGSAVAVWTQTMNNERRATVQVALQDSAYRWGQPTTLSESGSDAQRPTIATNGHDVAVTWGARFGQGSRIMVTEFDGTWAKPQAISPSGATNPELVVDARGTTSVTWLHANKNAPTSVEFAQETTAGKFRIQQLTNKSESAVSQSIAVSESGQVSVVWYSLDGNYQVSRRDTIKFRQDHRSHAVLQPTADRSRRTRHRHSRRGDHGRLARDTQRYLPTHRLRDHDRFWQVVGRCAVTRSRWRRGQPAGWC